jgi:hypothetical protein
VKNPGWRARIRAGLDVLSPYTGTYVKLELEDGGIRTEQLASNPTTGVQPKKHYYANYGCSIDALDITGYNGYALPAASDMESAKQDAVSHFYSNLREHQTQFEGLNFAITIGGTISAIRHPAQALVDAIAIYGKTAARIRNAARRRGSKKVMRDAHNLIGDLWLEAVFGWKPLIGDIESAAEAAASINFEVPRDTKVSGKGKSETSANASIPKNGMRIGGVYSDTDGTLSIIATEKSSVRVTAMVRPPALVAGTNEFKTQQKLGFTFDAFVPTLWDILPYSFLVDYFSNIGDILNAYTVDQSRCHRYIVTEKIEKKRQFILVVRSRGAFTRVISGNGGKATYTTTTLTRLCPGGIGVPTLEYSIPKVDSLRWVNMAALLKFK